MELFGSLKLAIGLGAAVVAAAVVFRFLPGAPRHRLRRSTILYAFYLALLASSWASRRFGDNEALASVLNSARELCELFLIVNLGALLLFDVLLWFTRIDISDILHDLTVGAAYMVVVGWSIHRWGVNLTSIVATSAVVTAVIGLSLQSTLGNVIGGLALQLDDSIHDGDWVELENKMQGQVKKVRWRHTVIETRDHDTLIVPNNQLLTQTIKILGKREGAPLQHRMWVYFNVDHRFVPGDVIRLVEEALQSAPIAGVAKEPKPQVICFDLAREHRDSYCYYAARYHLTDIARDDPTNSAVRERIYAALRRAQIPLALPAAALFLSHEDAKSEKRQQKLQSSIVSALRGVDLFSRLEAEELARLAESAKITPFVRGEVATRQGATAHWLYVLSKGEVEVRIAGDDGSERRVAVLKAPAFFGEMALMTGAPREATVVALNDVECLRVDKDDFREVIAARPELAKEISEVLAKRRVELEAARDNLDHEAKLRRTESERSRILGAVREFFALHDD
ncbi:MAG: cyclic nucleotide-binding domain-containing protein [Myxococcota bacterium]